MSEQASREIGERIAKVDGDMCKEEIELGGRENGELAKR